MARGPLGVTRAGHPRTVKHGGPGTLDFTVRSIRGGRRRVMEELAPLAVDFEPRLEHAVTRWQELTPWQRRSVTLDDLAAEAGLTGGEFLAATAALAATPGARLLRCSSRLWHRQAGVSYRTRLSRGTGVRQRHLRGAP